MPSASAEVERALSRCRFFAESRVWPFHARIHPEKWLNNFTDDEIPHAVSLLESFLYFSPEMVNAMLVSVFRSLATEVIDVTASPTDVRAAWTSFLNTAVFTHVAGEKPNASDSGHIFVRKLRQELGIPESRLFYHPEALAELEQRDSYLIFVDDFVGSGQQFTYTWLADRPNVHGQLRSFSQVADPTKVIYCPLICTARGRARIEALRPVGIRVHAAHVIPDEYGALHPQSVIWPEHLRADAPDFLRVVSARAGVPAAEQFGFDQLGLALGFDHSVPDATLRIIYWEENGWNPLLLRT